MDLAAIHGAYRADGHGAAAYEPSMMALLLYAYATEQRSSRAIERHCRQDVAYCVITGNVIPDHATIAGFVVRHEAALAQLFGEVLKLCDRGGLVRAGVIAIDGTRLAGNASKDRNRGFERTAKEILAEAKATDAAEEEQHGEGRGDELPEGRRAGIDVREVDGAGDAAALRWLPRQVALAGFAGAVGGHARLAVFFKSSSASCDLSTAESNLPLTSPLFSWTWPSRFIFLLPVTAPRACFARPKI